MLVEATCAARVAVQAGTTVAVLLPSATSPAIPELLYSSPPLFHLHLHLHLHPPRIPPQTLSPPHIIIAPHGVGFPGPRPEGRHGTHASSPPCKTHQAPSKGAGRRYIHGCPGTQLSLPPPSLPVLNKIPLTVRDHRPRLLSRPPRNKTPARIPQRPRLTRPIMDRLCLSEPHGSHVDPPFPSSRYLLRHSSLRNPRRHPPQVEPHGACRRYPEAHP